MNETEIQFFVFIENILNMSFGNASIRVQGYFGDLLKGKFSSNFHFLPNVA